MGVLLVLLLLLKLPLEDNDDEANAHIWCANRQHAQCKQVRSLQSSVRATRELNSA